MAGIPDEHASRRERFAELDELQPGWVVKLSTKADGGTVDATFTSPGGAPMPTASARDRYFANGPPWRSVAIPWHSHRLTAGGVSASYAGSAVGSYVAARRAALAAKKQAVTEEQQGTGHHHGIAVA